MAQQIQLRNDTTAGWTDSNPTLAQGEIGINTTLGQFKIGDGTTAWADLDYASGGATLALPLSIQDTNGDDLIVFEKGGTGVARIHAVQDDLALRSARDIILYPGDDGPGNVYINWGDATIAPDATNRVATLADIDSAPKTWTATNDEQYTIYQASGGVEVTTTAMTTLSDEVGSPTDQVAQTNIQIEMTLATDGQLTTIIADEDIRSIVLDVDGHNRVLYNPTRVSADETYAIWSFSSDTPITLSSSSGYGFTVTYGGPSVLWWNADDLGFVQDSNNYWQFRGAKIDYHAYVTDAGTIIGTIYIASDEGGDNNVTHIETSSGGNDVGAAILWRRQQGSGSERKLYLYRTDGEGQLHKIHWTAQVYYATEYYGD